jgi:hypothetical protein
MPLLKGQEPGEANTAIAAVSRGNRFANSIRGLFLYTFPEPRLPEAAVRNERRRASKRGMMHRHSCQQRMGHIMTVAVWKHGIQREPPQHSLGRLTPVVSPLTWPSFHGVLEPHLVALRTDRIEGKLPRTRIEHDAKGLIR